MSPTVTVAVSTCNRAELWRKGFPITSLKMQTDLRFELLICDDGSKDATLQLLPDLLADAPFDNVRIFRTDPPKRNAADSILADNVLIAEASGDIFIHLDDDGYVTRRMVERVRSFTKIPDCVLWGELVFVNPDAPTVTIKSDDRLTREGIKDDTIVRLSPAMLSEWGALWAAPTAELRRIGGHDMVHYGFRGADARLGRRISKGLRTYYVTQDWFTFYHLGLTELQNTRKKGGDWREFLKRHRLPSQIGEQPTIVNGGPAYFTGESLRSKYELVWERDPVGRKSESQFAGKRQTG